MRSLGRENEENVARTKNCCVWPSSPRKNIFLNIKSVLILVYKFLENILFISNGCIKCLYIFLEAHTKHILTNISKQYISNQYNISSTNISAHNISRYKTYETTKHIIMLSISNYKTYQKQNISKKKHIKRKSYQNLIF